jgi:hypothetical protein
MCTTRHKEIIIKHYLSHFATDALSYVSGVGRVVDCAHFDPQLHLCAEFSVFRSKQCHRKCIQSPVSWGFRSSGFLRWVAVWSIPDVVKVVHSLKLAQTSYPHTQCIPFMYKGQGLFKDALTPCKCRQYLPLKSQEAITLLLSIAVQKT